ncbi:MAG: transcription-repair coupling factor, partial [Bacteroidales bacterium]|nr:transcription-repair coupling factor [Bacteroidales bacterium]
TPPPNRLPVETEVIDFNEDYIKEAIENEIKRGGQVFFVHNRVEDILAVEQMINRICPMAKTIVGHGKMEPSLLENRILDFIRGDYDVLISTTIIENGIDIPNANTMIINQAQMFGLSDLHQLRGRVGRSNRRAYCYLIVPPMSSITEDAKRRIKAIEAFSELGSGFNIAMQDLDIRGAGNMLGGEQSGFIADMGFETYQKILNEAFIEINAQRPDFVNPIQTTAQFVSDCTVETDLEIFIPDEYIPQPTEKIKLYKDLDAVKEESDIEPFIESLKDRFGTPPSEVLELANVVRLRLAAVKIGVERIILKSGIMRLYFVSDANSAFYRTELYQKIMGRIATLRGAKLNYKPQEKKLTLTVPGVKSVTAAYGIICSLGA